MTPRQWERLTVIFEEAIALPADSRSQFVRVACPEDPEIRAELDRMLLQHAKATGPLDIPVLVQPRDSSPGAEPTFATGEVVLDRFRIVRFIRGGGMGEVYEAWDLDLNGRVAIKTIRPEIARDPPALARFHSEIQMARRVTHENACRIYEFLTAPRRGNRPPVAFLTMEFLDGPTLSARIREQGPLPSAEVEEIVVQLCAGLDAAHRAEVVHRDFKSGNIMLVSRQGGALRAVITDFGLARDNRPANLEDVTKSILTRPGAVMGTYPYMAPEQFESKPVSAATDIYALGIVIYEMLTATLPFQSESPTAAAVQRAKPPAPASTVRPGIARFWDRIIDRCLRYEQDARFQSAAELVGELRATRSALTRLKAAAKRAGRKRTQILAVAAVICVAVAGALWYGHATGYRPPGPEARKWYDQGTADLREGTFLSATNALQRAVAIDNNYVLARARLADAWAELDFPKKASDEMLQASSLEMVRNLPEIDRQYVEAVRSTITRDFPAAADRYRKIIGMLPENERAYGYVDLGRINEKTEKIDEAIRDYSTASKLQTEDPAPLMRLGILESRQKRVAEGEAAFAKADRLYKAASNLEGQAEIDYQRGYTANNQGQLDVARQFLKKALEKAQAIPSLQLEVRSLIQLSAVEYQAGNAPESEKLANEAIQKARDGGIEYWATDGLIRLGTAYRIASNFPQAEKYYQLALSDARHAGRPRLEALANLSLAVMRGQQHKPNDVLSLATASVNWYRPNGFFVESTQAMIAILRARRDLGQSKDALGLAQEALEVSRKADNKGLSVQTYELVGSLQLELERYPEALESFHQAVALSRDLPRFLGYELIQCADVAWRLGNYEEAENLLKEARAQKTFSANDVDRISAEMLLSQKRFPEAIRTAQLLLDRKPPPDTDAIVSAELVQCRARIALGNKSVAPCDNALRIAKKEADPEMMAEVNLAMADFLLASGDLTESAHLAESARSWFAAAGKRESEWQGNLCLARIATKQRDTERSGEKTKNALDILSEFQHNWGTSAYNGYISRPDMKDLMKELKASP